MLETLVSSWKHMDMILNTIYVVTTIAIVLFNGGLSLPEGPTCNELDVYEGTREAVSRPWPGTDLPYCKTPDLQCCTAHYFDGLKNTMSSELMAGAQADLTNSFRPWNESFQKLLESLEEFIHSFIDNFPFPDSLKSIAQSYLNEVEELLTAQLNPLTVAGHNKFNFTNLMYELTSELINRFTSNIPVTTNQKQCLATIIHSHIGRPSLQNIGEALQELQQIYQTLQKIEQFLSGLTVSDSIGYSTSEQCIEAVLSLQCDQCKKNIPSLCENVCASVVIGCLSPLQDGLHSQMEALWNVTKQLVLSTRDLIDQTLRVDQPAILPATALPQMSATAYQDCDGLNLLTLLGLSSRKRRYIESIDLPVALEPAVERALSLSGVFSFNGNSLPTYCSSSSVGRDCWNGQEQVENGTVSSNHILKAYISDQKDANGYYAFDLDSLHQQAASIRNPTREFFESPDFQQGLPADVNIPEIESYIAPEPVVKEKKTSSSVTLPSITPTTDTTDITIPPVKGPTDVPDKGSRTVNSLHPLTVLGMSIISAVILGILWR